MGDVGREVAIRRSSLGLRRGMTVLSVVLWVLLVLERFGWMAVALGKDGLGAGFARHLAVQVVAALPEVLYLLALWWVRASIAGFASGDLYGTAVTGMLRRVGATLGAGACLNVFVVPGMQRLLGEGPGYWIAFDVTGLVLAAIGLSLVIVARVLDNARAMKAELDEIF